MGLAKYDIIIRDVVPVQIKTCYKAIFYGSLRFRVTKFNYILKLNCRFWNLNKYMYLHSMIYIFFFWTRKIKSKFIIISRKYYIYLTLKISKIKRKNAHLESYMHHRNIRLVLHESKKQLNSVTCVKHSIPTRKRYFVWEKISKFSSFLFQFSLLSRYIWVVIAKRQMAASNGKGWDGNPSVERGATVQLMSGGGAFKD